MIDFCAARRRLVASSGVMEGRQRARWPRKMPVMNSVVTASQEMATCSGTALALALAAMAAASIVVRWAKGFVGCRFGEKNEDEN